jgi:hypothetical protein
MPTRLQRVSALAVLATFVGCLRQFVPAPLGTPVDEACNPTNGNLTVATDTVRFNSARLPLHKGWVLSNATVQELSFRRIDAELTVWRGPEFVFPAIAPRNAVRCTIQRGDTTISIQAVRLDGFRYRVDVEWAPLIDGQHFYLQLQTRYVEHLKQLRGTIDNIWFVPDTTTAKRRE